MVTSKSLDIGLVNKYIFIIINKLVDGLKKTKSYHDRVLEKYPTVDYFEDFEKEHILDAKPAIYAYDRSFFLPKGTKLDPTKMYKIFIII